MISPSNFRSQTIGSQANPLQIIGSRTTSQQTVSPHSAPLKILKYYVGCWFLPKLSSVMFRHTLKTPPTFGSVERFV